MFRLTAKLIPFRLIKLILKFIASLASAIMVVSGYLFFISNTDRSRETEIVIDDPDLDTGNDPETSDDAGADQPSASAFHR